MEPTIDFFFEFASPYSYIASVRLTGLAARLERRLRWRPIELESVWQRQGLQDAYAVIRSAKRAYIRADAQRVAEHHGIRMARPGSPIRADLARLAVYALKLMRPGLGGQFAAQLFRQIWTDGRKLEGWSDVVHALPPGIDGASLHATLSRQDVTQQLEHANAQAAQLGCFGVPWLHADAASFFGQDRLPLLERHLSRS